MFRFRPRSLYHRRHSRGRAFIWETGWAPELISANFRTEIYVPLAGLEPRFVGRLVLIVVIVLSEFLRLILIKKVAEVVSTCVM